MLKLLFDNNLFVRVSAIDKVPHLMENSFDLWVNNNDSNEDSIIIDGFDLSIIKASKLLINTNDSFYKDGECSIEDKIYNSLGYFQIHTF